MGGNRKGVASLICGIFILFVSGIVFGVEISGGGAKGFTILTGIIAIGIILGLIGRKSDDNPAIATIGLILGIIDVMWFIIIIVFFGYESLL
jgi:hypothetical protein